MGAGTPSEPEALMLDNNRGEVPEKVHEIVLT
jgi:hypothetical protein